MEIDSAVSPGKTVELEADPGLPDGQRSEVVIPRVHRQAVPGEEVVRSAGSMADDPEFDTVRGEVERDRHLLRRPAGFGRLPWLCAVAFLTAATARADLIVTPNAPATPTLRSIEANATAVPNKTMNVPIQSKTGGGFNDSQQGNATDANGGSAVEAKASQNSSIPNLTGLTMTGTGSAEVTWNPGVGQAATVDSLFDVFFTVDANDKYLLSGRLTNNTKQLAAITTLSASLLDKTNSNSLANHTDAGPFSDLVMLTKGNTYELKLDVRIDGNLGGVMGTTIEDASWQFNLATVPEPSTFILIGIGALGFAGWEVRRRRSERSMGVISGQATTKPRRGA